MKPAFVLDASMALKWCFTDEATPATTKLFRRMATECAAVPSLWHYEMANSLTFGRRRERISAEKAAHFVTLLASFHFDTDNTGSTVFLATLAGLAWESGLTAYDAAYLELAIRRGLPLATADDALERAARLRGLDVFTHCATP